MAFWNRWGGKSFTARDAAVLAELNGVESWSGESVTPHQAMQLSAYWACTRLIAQTIATLPLGIYERAKGDRISRPDHELYRLLHDSPNADQTAVEFWEGRLFGLCTSGGGFAEKKLSASGRLISLEPMPADTGVERKPDGSLRYRFNDRGQNYDLPEEKVFHIRGFGDGDTGFSPVAMARQTLGLTVATEKAAGGMFAKGMRAKGFMVMPSGTKLDAEQRKQAKAAFIDPYTGPNGASWGVLEGGVEPKIVSISPKDAEMITSRKFNVEDICRWHGVPPILIGHSADGQTMWGSGIEQVLIAWLTLGLRPYLKRVEQAISKRLIAPGERGRIYAEFNVEGLLRADSAGRAEYYSKMVQNAGITPNEIRLRENLPPLPGGDDLLINSTLIPLKHAGRDLKSGSAGAPVKTS